MAKRQPTTKAPQAEHPGNKRLRSIVETLDALACVGHGVEMQSEEERRLAAELKIPYVAVLLAQRMDSLTVADLHDWAAWGGAAQLERILHETSEGIDLVIGKEA